MARLRQVLLNLAGNAVKFTEHGGVALIVAPGAAPGEIGFLVRDTGIGIATEAQERIFEEFEQADGGTTRRFGGSGLGLAISRRIVERMGGSIAVESAPGQGARFGFTVALPRAEAADASPAHDPVTPDLSGKAVLIVAPGPIEAPLIAQRLGRWGGSTCVVADAAAARAVLHERHFDTLLIDHALGLDAATGLLREAGNVPSRIVLVTPAERHDLAAFRQAGFTGYLVKPVRAASLAARFGEALDMDPPAASESPKTADAVLAILVAEDNEINALLARALLARLGHRATVAPDGAAALEAFLAAPTPYDLVLMDVHMPLVDGIEATRRIRAAEAASGRSRTPIIALTANAFGEEREACLAAGMDDFLVKPLDRERLAEVLAGSRTSSLAA
jgi:CheY-like chemotaxis protein